MEFYIDLSKAILNTGKLVKKQVQVRGKNGKVFNRMQWVDPSDGSVVAEHGTHEHDEERQKHMNMDEQSKKHTIQNMHLHDEPHLRKFAHHTGLHNHQYASQDELVHHGLKHFDHLPTDKLDKHAHKKDDTDWDSKIDHLLEPDFSGSHTDDDDDFWDDEDDTPSKSGEHDPLKHLPKLPTSLENSSYSLSPESVDDRMGRTGPLDSSMFTKGTPVHEVDYFKDDFADANSELKHGGYSYTAEETWQNTFGNVTHEGLEHAFTVPGYKSRMVSLQVHGDQVQTPTCQFTMSLKGKDGNEVGTVVRQVSRDDKGLLYIHNEEFVLNEKHQGKGIADNIYAQSEQLWKHMSQGNKTKIGVVANISVGCYAWAKKGFDFKDDTEVKMARRELAMFVRKNGWDLNETLKDCGYNDLDDLSSAHQFATLNDGNSYDLGEMSTSRKKFKGAGHLGKAFMLGGKTMWEGVRTLNDDSVSEKIAALNKKFSELRGVISGNT